MATQQSKVPWGELADGDGDGDYVEDLDFLLPPKQVIGPDENGIKKVIEYKFNDEGKMVRIIRTILIRKLAETRLNNHAIERRSWAVFGDAVNEDAGGRLTMISNEEIILERPKPPGIVQHQEKTKTAKGGGTLMVCRMCGKKGDHWTAQCPYKDLAQPSDTFVDTSSTETRVAPPGVATSSAYVPPSRRAGATERTGTTGGDMRRRNEENGVRINNLPEETTQQDLHDLCSPFGQVSRVFVATDRETGLCRGFGTVNFARRDDAEKAIMKLNNYGYDHLILKVEWDRHKAT